MGDIPDLPTATEQKIMFLICIRIIISLKNLFTLRVLESNLNYGWLFYISLRQQPALTGKRIRGRGWRSWRNGERDKGSPGVEIERVGERKQGQIRPMKLRMEIKEWFWRCWKGQEKHWKVQNHVSGSDRTTEKRSAHKQLVADLKEKRDEFPDSVFYIRGIGSVKKQELLWLLKADLGNQKSCWY